MECEGPSRVSTEEVVAKIYCIEVKDCLLPCDVVGFWHC